MSVAPDLSFNRDIRPMFTGMDLREAYFGPPSADEQKFRGLVNDDAMPHFARHENRFSGLNRSLNRLSVLHEDDADSARNEVENFVAVHVPFAVVLGALVHRAFSAENSFDLRIPYDDIFALLRSTRPLRNELRCAILADVQSHL
jgi:hypothetical protein